MVTAQRGFPDGSLASRRRKFDCQGTSRQGVDGHRARLLDHCDGVATGVPSWLPSIRRPSLSCSPAGATPLTTSSTAFLSRNGDLSFRVTVLPERAADLISAGSSSSR